LPAWLPSFNERGRCRSYCEDVFTEGFKYFEYQAM